MKKRMLRPPTSPGEILWEEFLKPLGLSQVDFAHHLRWSQPKVNEIIQGKRGVSPEAAMMLADALGTTPQFWLNAQQAVDLWKAQKRYKPVKKLPQISKSGVAS